MPTDASFGHSSSLWLWWKGFELSRRRIKLFAGNVGPQEETEFSATCTRDGDFACTWQARALLSTSDVEAEYMVAMFTSGDSTVLPPSLFSDHDELKLHLYWYDGNEEQSMTIEGPFVLGYEHNKVVLSHRLRHRFSFRYCRTGRMYIAPLDNIDVSNHTVDFLFTVASVYALIILFYKWVTRDVVTYFLVLTLIPVMFLYTGSYLRLVILVYITLRVFAGMLQNAYALSAEYVALEALWSITMILHEEETNITSTFLKAILLSICLRDVQKNVKRFEGRLSPMFVVDGVLSLLLTSSFITDDLMPLFEVELGARYGLKPLIPSVFVALLFIEVSVHLR